MPRAIQYKANSVIYFAGDIGDKIFILQSGKVTLRSKDIETGDEIIEVIQMGQFFGVKSALGRYPREDDAMVIKDSQVLVFTVPEFEQMASGNTRIILKMLKVFSGQLRRMHQKVRNLLAQGLAMSPEDGLYSIAYYYLEKKLYKEAIYTLRRYQKLYPHGSHLDDVNKYLPLAEQYAQKYGQGRGPALLGGSKADSGGMKLTEEPEDISTPEDEAYYAAVNLVGQGDYQQAMEKLKPIVTVGADHPRFQGALFEIGRCFFGMGQFDKAIKHFQGFLQNFPDFEEKGEALFLVGSCFEKSGDKDKAKDIFTKLSAMADADEASVKKAKKALHALGA